MVTHILTVYRQDGGTRVVNLNAEISNVDSASIYILAKELEGKHYLRHIIAKV